MEALIFPEGYRSVLSLKDTQKATEYVRSRFQINLGNLLHLNRITCPLFVTKESGINDDLNGVERKVEFDMKNVDGTAQVVQSLAKWKRVALARYGFEPGEGIYTNMAAIRRDDLVDSLHSMYVDQWDWERVITKEDRNKDFLEHIVRRIVCALADTQEEVNWAFPAINGKVERNTFFITSQGLEDRYPDLSPKERENAICREKKTVFVEQIGGLLKSGQKHDGRAPDYDDWSLNGDLFLWNDVLGCAEEISSMGIRVDAESLKKQLQICGAEDRMKYPYHRGILDGTLPLTIGGGIGQSRVCMYMLKKAHIGEVQVSVWPDDMVIACAEHGIQLL